jgi:hypothetical protein
MLQFDNHLPLSLILFFLLPSSHYTIPQNKLVCLGACIGVIWDWVIAIIAHIDTVTRVVTNGNAGANSVTAIVSNTRSFSNHNIGIAGTSLKSNARCGTSQKSSRVGRTSVISIARKRTSSYCI